MVSDAAAYGELRWNWWTPMQRKSPLRNWTTEKTFNSASACNKARASNYEKFKVTLGMNLETLGGRRC
jgi:hypothetical protein